MKLFAIVASLFVSATAFGGPGDTNTPPPSQEGFGDWSISSSSGSPESGIVTSVYTKVMGYYSWEFRYEIGRKSAAVLVQSLDFLEDELAMKKYIAFSAAKGVSSEVRELQNSEILPLLIEGSASSLQLAQQKWSAEIHRLALIGYPQPN